MDLALKPPYKVIHKLSTSGITSIGLGSQLYAELSTLSSAIKQLSTCLKQHPAWKVGELSTICYYYYYAAHATWKELYWVPSIVASFSLPKVAFSGNNGDG